MKRCIEYLLFCLFCFFTPCHDAFGQERPVLSGFIEDSQSGERIIGAAVYDPDSRTGTVTNKFGFFSLVLPSDSIDIEISFIGFKTRTLNLYLSQDSTVVIKLKASSLQLDEAKVSGYKIRPQSSILTSKEIKAIPPLLGESDVLRVIQTLPGVQGGLEGFTGMHVRGGSPDQNLLLLDGAQVYNASHLFGLFSVFNTDVVKSVELIKGRFPAKYGGRLSSVLEVNLKEGNNKEFAGGAALGLISSKFYMEGPILKEKMSFIASGRRTYFDLLEAAFGTDFLPIDYFFDDFNVKLNYDISPNDRIYLSTYMGQDRYQSRPSFITGDQSTEMKWRNITSILRWNRIFNNQIFGNLSLHYTRYQLTANQVSLRSSQGEIANVGVQNSSNIQDLGLSYIFDHRLSLNHELNYGAHYLLHDVEPSLAQYSDASGNSLNRELTTENNRILGHELSLFIEDDWKVNNRFSLRTGLHYSLYSMKNATYDMVQPRLAADYALNERWSINASYSSMYQYIHMLTNLGFGLPADLWVASTQKIRPQKSHQLTFGSIYSVYDWDMNLKLEGFYKRMSDLITYKEGIAFSYNTDWEDLLISGGNGQSFGLEFSAERKEGKFTGRANYTLSWSTRQFDEINDGEVYPYRYDRRHLINFTGSYAFSKKFSLSASWTYMSGQAFTAPLSIIPLQGGGYIDYSERNGLRFPEYHRLDIGMNFVKETSWGERTWSFSLYNAYNRTNPFYLLPWEDDETSQVDLRIFNLFPIIPSVQYSLRF